MPSRPSSVEQRQRSLGLLLGLSQSEIADWLKLPLGTVKTWRDELKYDPIARSPRASREGLLS
ncbi:MAG: hypothetical protein MRJ92_02380 [Nitrospira sp.]|nr:hypothetical protein [Nitrospira sp.]